MRDTKVHSLLPALLCAFALFSFACNRGEEERAGEVSTGRETVSGEAQPQTNELRPQPRAVDVQEEVADLEARERELAAREVELDARESLLREREQQARSPQRREAPRPATPPRRETEDRRAERTSARKPAPAPAPAREEPAREARREEPARGEEPAREEPAREEPRREEPVREEPAREREEAEEQPEEQPLITTVSVPAGTVFDVEFTDTLASNASAAGETFRVRVAQDVMEDGEVAIPAGSEILGEVTEAVPLRKKVGGQARLTLKFTDLVLPSGTTVPIDASFVQQGRSETRKDAATIGGGAAAGAVLGRILNKGNRSKGAVIGAIIGAAAGAAIASKTPGEEVVIPEGSVVSLRLDDAIEVRVKPRR